MFSFAEEMQWSDALVLPASRVLLETMTFCRIHTSFSTGNDNWAFQDFV
jgi:hypothetical protein